MVRRTLRRILARLNGSYWRCNDCDRYFITDERMQRHREIAHDDNMEIYRCTECGRIEQNIGALHGHAEKHTPFYSFANVDRLMEYTEKLEVTDYRELDPLEEGAME